jgi:uncharacterized protein YlzI (FlbEa/FlbD family)
VIAVTCRNGEYFTIDPDAIERVETTNDTTLHMVDGSKYVIDLGLDDLITVVRDHRAAAVAVCNRLADDVPAVPAVTPALTVLPDRDQD